MPSEFSFTFEGLDAALRALSDLGPTTIRQAARGVYAEAEAVMSEAKELCPVDTGALRATGHVQRPVTTDTEFEVVLGFGGPAAPYAERQHEDLTLRHTVGQAKFLEQPLASRSDRIRRVIEQAPGDAFEELT